MRSAGLPWTPTAISRPAARRWGLAAAAAFMLAATSLAGCTSQPPATPGPTASGNGIGKIRHVVVIMQENRSFDSYFGTYPGADGIPARNGQFTVCVPDPRSHGCDKPYHDPSLVNGGAGHNMSEGVADIDGGKMDGFVTTAEDQPSRGCSATNPPTPACLPTSTPDVMGYHDARELRTTGRTPTTSSCRITCSSRSTPGPCRPTCTWSAAGRRRAPAPAPTAA